MSVIFSLIIFNITCSILLFFYTKDDNLKPTKITFIFLCSTFIVWSSFIFGIFPYFTIELEAILWDVSWIYLILIGITALFFEVKNSRIYVIFVLLVNSINVVFFGFSNFIGNM